MRLRVAPGSLWLAYDVRAPERLKACLPPDLELAPVRVFEDDPPLAARPKLLFNFYTVDSAYMRGQRLDVQVYALDRHTRTAHLVVLQCLTNTLQWDPVSGVRGPNARAVGARGSRGRRDSLDPKEADGRVVVDLRTSRHRFAVAGDRASERRVGRRFAVEANRACYFAGWPVPVRMSFDEDAVAAPVRVVRADEIVNSLWADSRVSEPSHAFVHPHPMEFDVLDPPYPTPARFFTRP